MYADLSGAVTAVNESNGRIRWSRALGTDVYGERLIGRTLVVDIDQVGSHAQVIGLNPTSGALDWRYRPGGDGLYGDPVPAGDVGLVIVASPHELALVDAASGKLRWRRSIASPGEPVTDGTTVAVAADNSTMRGFVVATGDLRWTRGGIDSTALLTLDDGVVAVGSQVTPDPTPIAGYELATGRRAWALGLDAGSWQLTATTAGLVAVQDYPVDQGGLDLVEPATGHIAWRSSIGHPAFLATEPVVVGSDLAMVVQLPQNGPSFALLRHLTTGSSVASTASDPVRSSHPRRARTGSVRHWPGAERQDRIWLHRAHRPRRCDLAGHPPPAGADLSGGAPRGRDSRPDRGSRVRHPFGPPDYKPRKGGSTA